MFGADELGLEALGLVDGVLDGALGVGRELDDDALRGSRPRRRHLLHRGAEAVEVEADGAEGPGRDGAAVAGDADEEVVGSYLRGAQRLGRLLRGAHGLLGPVREILFHEGSSPGGDNFII